jgi:hypothetical protein
MKDLMFETNFKADLNYVFNKVKLNTIRFKNGKVKINLVFLKQYIFMIKQYLIYIHVQPFIK